jgi:hypothetical protein
MDVYFDFELNRNANQPENANILVYQMIREFVQSRYRVLDDELYANCTEDNRPFCVLLLEPEGLIIRYVDIEEPLLTKVQECISEVYFRYIADVIWKKIQSEKRRN